MKLMLPTMLLVIAGASMPDTGRAETYSATPENYRSLIKQLKAGDELLLAPGIYRDTLPLHGLNGTPQAPIIIRGSSGREKTTFVGMRGANTVSLSNSAYLVVDSLVLDGQGLEVDGVKAEGTASYVHHIALSRLTIINHGYDQAIVGIAAMCPSWGWIIRDNVIDGAGTGIYLGHSNGMAPFVGGLIERNIIRNTHGYNMQIKHQKSRPLATGMPEEPLVTIIRDNVFVKSENASTGDLARPNLLVGHFPLSGPGSQDRYLIYGNFFYDNATEALFQGEGNIALYNNVFVNPRGPAIHIQPHNATPRDIEVFNNTVLARGDGILVRGVSPGFRPSVYGNAVFADGPMIGITAPENLAAPFTAADHYLRSPNSAPPQLDVSPQEDKLGDSAPALERVTQFLDWDLEFGGTRRRQPTFGALSYHERGWPLRLDAVPGGGRPAGSP